MDLSLLYPRWTNGHRYSCRLGVHGSVCIVGTIGSGHGVGVVQELGRQSVRALDRQLVRGLDRETGYESV
jgi:hypothetical protein